MKSKVLLSLSGGVDSTALYSRFHTGGFEVHPYFFKYPSKHNDMEHQAASRVAAHYEMLGQFPLAIIDTTAIFQGVKSHLLIDGGDIPSSEYTKESLSLTVVPGRNLIFASILASQAQSLWTSEDKEIYIALGMHAGDHEIYADCRPEFVKALRETVSQSSEDKVTVFAPLIELEKYQVVLLGADSGAPFELTRSCYNGGDRPCRVCSTCLEREKAFAKAGMEDPILKEI